MSDHEVEDLLRIADRRSETVTTPTSDQRPARRDLAAILEAHLAEAAPHPAGTTDRLLAADRERPY